MRTHLDLFSGLGGFALAAEWTGWRTIAFAETASYPGTVLARKFPHVPNYGDVTKLCRRVHDCDYDDETGEAWCPRCETEFGECDCTGTDQFIDEVGWPALITGGVPCQPASAIGAQRGTLDERWLWPDTLRIMRELRPHFGVFENPPALLTLESGRAFAGILGGLAALGYDVLWECVPAAALGAGHRRERVFVVATHADRARLEGHTGDAPGGGSGGTRPHRPVAAPDLRARKITGEKWYAQSGIQPVVDGVPFRLACNQLTAIGNAVVPEAAAVFLAALARESG